MAISSHGAAEQTAPAGTVDPSGEAVALLRGAAETMASVTSFHFELTHERGATALTQGIEVQTLEGDVQRPDRFRADVEASLQGLPLELRVVGIGSRLWLTDPLGGGDQYQELSVNPAVIAAINPDALLRAAVDAIQDPEIVDEETIDGEPTTVVEGLLDVGQVALAGLGTPAADMETPAADDLPDPLLVQIWIDAEGRVVRLRLDGPLTDAEAANVVRRLDLSAFDEEVDIQPPGR